MRSGFGDYYVRAFNDRIDEFKTISDYLELFRTFELEFEPDTDERYSNVGYVILGGIVEAVTGTTYHDYVSKHIFEPAGMTGSSFRGRDEDDPLAAIGYTNHGPSGRKGFVETNRALLDVRGNPAGGSFSPAVDLLRFNRALRNDDLLSREGTTLVLTRFRSEDQRPSVTGTAGGAPGISAVNLEDAKAGVCVIVLSNHDEPMAELIGEQIFGLLRGPLKRSPEAVGTVVPMKRVGDQPAVEVHLGNEGPLLFLIDTGDSGSGSISRELADRLGLRTVGQVEVGDPSGRNSEKRDLVRIPQLNLGEHRWRDVDVLLNPHDRMDPGIDGVLGFALFREGLFTLDYPAEEVRLGPGELPPPDDREILPFRDESGIPMIDLDVAGHRVEADLDSGSMGWLMIPEAQAREIPLAAEPVVVGKARTSFNEFEIKSAPLAAPVRLGRHQLDEPRLEMASIFPHGNIGSRFLSLFSVTFDRANRRVRFSRDEGQPLRPAPRYRVGVMLAAGPEGMEVRDTVPDSPAAHAGLLAGDRILAINGVPVGDLPSDALAEVFSKPEEIQLEIDRDGEQRQMKLTPELTE